MLKEQVSHLQNKVRKETKIKFFKVIAALVRTYGSETCKIRKPESQKIQSAEMKFMRRTKGFTLRYHIRNKNMRAEFNIFSMNDRIRQFVKMEIAH